MEHRTYEQAITRLEEIVKQLESGTAALDDALQLFEEGTKLAAFCSQTLDTAEQKLRTLSEVQKAGDTE
ncbi:MAG TPA: exodeoxyribonuclease VII small subunit [Candidatus Fimenecus excrementigallinarum]|uniref:Exodeoxyribonuclease 7 small subunit n=1 Tax=Candidatus Fimenecus excrementigallinarum TaxID=2840816 RepID=A0A9D1IGX3_9FIRM|nr:exodeoxyribonuclease VII small subunit [Candidatus Fimenecus excrementigallinarum]